MELLLVLVPMALKKAWATLFLRVVLRVLKAGRFAISRSWPMMRNVNTCSPIIIVASVKSSHLIVHWMWLGTGQADPHRRRDRHVPGFTGLQEDLLHTAAGAGNDSRAEHPSPGTLASPHATWHPHAQAV